YPDHHQFRRSEFHALEEALLRDGIRDVVITQKDKYHLSDTSPKINIFTMEIEIDIENDADFLQRVERVLERKMSQKKG
ncbi:MAG: tetraacyldisaccharide 4'-kinase, partial [Candidatus Omnitrophota bacterium]